MIRSAKREKWWEFTTELGSIPAQAKLMKIIYTQPQPALGLLTSADTFTGNIDQSNKLLLDEHFPRNMACRWADPQVKVKIKNEFEWILLDLVKKAIKRFQKGKTPGPDNIHTETLKNLPEEAIVHLTALIEASFTFGYIHIYPKTRENGPQEFSTHHSLILYPEDNGETGVVAIGGGCVEKEPIVPSTIQI